MGRRVRPLPDHPIRGHSQRNTADLVHHVHLESVSINVNEDVDSEDFCLKIYLSPASQSANIARTILLLRTAQRGSLSDTRNTMTTRRDFLRRGAAAAGVIAFTGFPCPTALAKG